MTAAERNRWDTPCPSDQCPMCTGEACRRCGAGCWSNVRDCDHGVLERHEEPEPING